MALPPRMEDRLPDLSLETKVSLLSGAGSCSTVACPRFGIPQLNTSDGPHGVRGGGGRFFNSPPGYQLPCATAMGATFDAQLLREAGLLLGDEARRKDVHVALAPTVCIQRSPLLGRGFEAFGEDPILSGNLAAQLVNGIQSKGVASCIKHYAAHDQSAKGLEDDVHMTERTLRELHLLPFQIALAKSQPLSFMTAYQKINGIHASEDPFLLKDILRGEWGFDGLVMSDWWGTYSTSEALNAGLDLEMPGPCIWRGKQLMTAVEARKVSIKTVDDSVRRLLQLIDRTLPSQAPGIHQGEDTSESRSTLRKLSADSIVLLKNDRGVLPLDKATDLTYGLIGEPFEYPLTGGGGSSEAVPFYVSKPKKAFEDFILSQNVRYERGCNTRRWTPLIESDLMLPDSVESGLLLEWFGSDPTCSMEAKPLYYTTTTHTSMYFSQMVIPDVPAMHFIRIKTTFKPRKTCTYRFALSVCGKARMWIDGKEAVDLWTSHPPKTDDTPCFNKLSMERTMTMETAANATYSIEILMCNQGPGPAYGAPGAGGLRLGGQEVVDDDAAIDAAVRLASSVDIPIVMAGLGADYEYEASDRTSLSLPLRTDEMIRKICETNPKTVVILQSGMPVAMPWVKSSHTLLHAWLGGQETGNAIVDILFGNVNPSGRLSLTFPERIEDTPTYLNFAKTDRTIMYGEGVFVGHRYYEKLDRPPLFYFGFGLSYTSFEYSNFTTTPMRMSDEDMPILEISVDVVNLGDRDGAEVLQVYVSDLESSVQRPVKELKAFAKLYLRRGERQSCAITLDKYAFSFWSEEQSKWVVEKGDFAIILARSADPKDVIERKTVEWKSKYVWSGL